MIVDTKAVAVFLALAATILDVSSAQEENAIGDVEGPFGILPILPIRP
eukprot:CAMPEP_0194361592 /NCGR_PEP_ID=MMETSP0174-20130528/9141_1 /TAXON_ID=216777 /ORGANISM="Proboscia alata, Strain PI-D3" /LENGTH=47 /DNA_ID= /DNA_START= /DNA_END= /DNA_ORIENTATION=